MRSTTIRDIKLKKQAQSLKPHILIGRKGLTREQINNIKTKLEIHHLIKIKFNEHKDQKQILTQKILEETDTKKIDSIGNTLIIYKEPTIT
jgi:RNA-binding protein